MKQHAAAWGICLAAAAAATMARISLPETEKNQYDPGFAAGTVAAGGTMGVLIPPSGALIIFALLTQMSVSELFVAGIVPGVLQIIIYVGVMAVVAKIRRSWGRRWLTRLGFMLLPGRSKRFA